MKTQITFHSGDDFKKAIEILENLAESKEEDLTKDECINVLKDAKLDKQVVLIQNMTKSEFEDFICNNIY